MDVEQEEVSLSVSSISSADTAGLGSDIAGSSLGAAVTDHGIDEPSCVAMLNNLPEPSQAASCLSDISVEAAHSDSTHDVSGPSHLAVTSSHPFQPCISSEHQTTETFGASNLDSLHPPATDHTNMLSGPVPFETITPPILETLPQRSCISLKETIEEAVSEELPKDIFDTSSENECPIVASTQTSHVVEKCEETPTVNPVPVPILNAEQIAVTVTATPSLPTSHVEFQPVSSADVLHITTPAPNDHVEQKPPLTHFARVDSRPVHASSILENKYMRAVKDSEGVDKRLAEVSNCPNLSLVDKVVITDVTTAKGTITVKECTTDEGFFSNNVSPGETQIANG